LLISEKLFLKKKKVFVSPWVWHHQNLWAVRAHWLSPNTTLPIKTFFWVISGSFEQLNLVDFGWFYTSFLAKNDFIKAEMKFDSKLHRNG
jgi:hypothetical protein